MRIGIWHNTGPGGARRHLHDAIAVLRERGHDMVACCPDTSDQHYLKISDLIPEKTIPLNLDRLPPAAKWYESSDARNIAARLDVHWREAALFLEKERIDVLLASGCFISSVPGIAKYFHGSSTLYLQDPIRANYEAFPGSPWAYPADIHHLPFFSRWGLRERWADGIKTYRRRLFVMQELESARCFKQIYVNSYYSRESILRAYGLNAVVCYPGISVSSFPAMGMPRERFVLGVGTFARFKNIRFIMRAMGKAKSKYPLVWIGNSGSHDLSASLQAEASALGINFQPIRGVSDQALIDYYNKASLLVCAARLEPFGYTPLEANACGCPVLATKEGGMRETVMDGYNGWLVDEDEDAFAAKLDQIMADDAAGERERAGKNGIEHVKQGWTLEQSVERLEGWLMKASGLDHASIQCAYRGY